MQNFPEGSVSPEPDLPESDTLNYEPSEQTSNPELTPKDITALLEIVKNLGFVEPEEIQQIREEFAANQPTDLEEIQGYVIRYSDALQAISELDTLAFNILLIVFYHPQQISDVENSFYDACNDAMQYADNVNPDVGDQLFSVIGKFLL